MEKKLRLILFVFSAVLAGNTPVRSQTICNPSGNLFILSNYDGGRVTINVDVNIPDLKIGICTYEPVQITISGAFAGNVTRVIYAGFNSNQNNNNCGLGNFSTSIAGVPVGIRSIITNPPVGFSNSNGNPTMVCAVGNCDPAVRAGGCNTADQIVYYFQQATGGILYAHRTQYACWINETVKLSEAGNCCVGPAVAPFADFGVSANQICAGDCIQFTNLSTGGPFTSVNWLFEGGTPAGSVELAPEICFDQAGVFQVSLSLSNGSGTDSEIKSGFIEVSEGPAAPLIQHQD